MKRLVIDTETTGLSHRFNKTLTVGMLLVDVEKDHLNILKSNHIFIKHNSGSVSSGAMKVNGINIIEHNKTAIEEEEACEEVNKFVDKNKLHKILDRRDAIAKALSLTQPGDLVLITGKGAEQKMCLANGKMIDWDDRKVVKEVLASESF